MKKFIDDKNQAEKTRLDAEVLLLNDKIRLVNRLRDEHEKDTQFAREEIGDLNDKVKYFKGNQKNINDYQEIMQRQTQDIKAMTLKIKRSEDDKRRIQELE